MTFVRLFREFVLILFVLSFLFVPSLISMPEVYASEDFIMDWEKTFGGSANDYGNASTATTEGYVIAGIKNSGVNGDAYLIKTDHDGNIIWERTYGDNKRDAFLDVQQTNDGGYIAFGYSLSYGSSRGKFYLVKTDSLGDEEWFKTYGHYDYTIGNSVKQTADGGYILLGNSTQTDAWLDFRLTKVDSVGNEEWTRFFGRSQDDTGLYVIQTSDGGYLLSGYSGGWSNSPKMWIIKTNASGNKQWEKLYGGTNRNSWDLAYSAIEVENNSYVIAGHIYNSTNNTDVALIKLDQNGNEIWYKLYGGTGYDYGYAVTQLVNGGYAVAGSTNSFGAGDSYGYLVITDSEGNELESQVFGQAGSVNRFFSIHALADNSIVLTGHTDSFGNGGHDVWLLQASKGAHNYPAPLSIETITLPAADQDEDYSTHLTASGGTEPYTWSILDGSLPVGLSLDSETGQITGIPAVSGDFSFTVQVADSAGLSATATVIVEVIDRTPPVSTVTATPGPNASGWNNTDVEVFLSASDDVGVATIMYKLDETDWAVYQGALTISSEGEHNLSFYATDHAGNQEAPNNLSIRTDKTPPVINGAPDREANAYGWYNADVTVSFTAADSLSGVKSAIQPVTLGEGADQSVTGTVVDLAGNTASATVSGINIDKTAPSISGAPDRVANANGWYNDDVTVSFTAADSLSGVDSVTQPVTLGEGGNLSVTGTAVDQAGNTASFTVDNINIDASEPAVVIASPDAQAYTQADVISILYTVDAGISGVDNMTSLLDGIPVASETTVQAYTLPLGSHTLVITVVDRAGNQTVQSISFVTEGTIASSSALIQEFTDLGLIDAEIAAALGASADTAQAAMDRGQTKAAQNNLEALINKIQAQSGKKVDASVAEVLIAGLKDAAQKMDNEPKKGK